MAFPRGAKIAVLHPVSLGLDAMIYESSATSGDANCPGGRLRSTADNRDSQKLGTRQGAFERLPEFSGVLHSFPAVLRTVERATESSSGSQSFPLRFRTLERLSEDSGEFQSLPSLHGIFGRLSESGSAFPKALEGLRISQRASDP